MKYIHYNNKHIKKNNLYSIYIFDVWRFYSILGFGYNSHKLKTTNTYI